jgi:hypothetical protein
LRISSFQNRSERGPPASTMIRKEQGPNAILRRSSETFNTPLDQKLRHFSANTTASRSRRHTNPMRQRGMPQVSCGTVNRPRWRVGLVCEPASVVVPDLVLRQSSKVAMNEDSLFQGLQPSSLAFLSLPGFPMSRNDWGRLRAEAEPEPLGLGAPGLRHLPRKQPASTPHSTEAVDSGYLSQIDPGRVCQTRSCLCGGAIPAKSRNPLL